MLKQDLDHSLCMEVAKLSNVLLKRHDVVGRSVVGPECGLLPYLNDLDRIHCSAHVVLLRKTPRRRSRTPRHPPGELGTAGERPRRSLRQRLPDAVTCSLERLPHFGPVQTIDPHVQHSASEQAIEDHAEGLLHAGCLLNQRLGHQALSAHFRFEFDECHVRAP